MLKPNGLEPIVELAARRVGRRGAVLLLLDSDDDCPAELGPQLRERILRYREDLLVGVVLAKREFEAWFLAAAASLAGSRGLASSLLPPDDPEAVRGAKEWLSRQMDPGRRYVETMDQPALTSLFDLEQARLADSFDKCDREIRGLLVRLKERRKLLRTPISGSSR
jgi:hypothetical protein